MRRARIKHKAYSTGFKVSPEILLPGLKEIFADEMKGRIGVYEKLISSLPPAPPRPKQRIGIGWRDIPYYDRCNCDCHDEDY